MTTNRKHTPLPWRKRRSLHGSKYAVVQIGPDDRYTTCDLESADAAFIVRAVNSHAALLEACRVAESSLQMLLQASLPDSEFGAEYNASAKNAKSSRKKLRAAIAAAEGR